MSHSGGVAPTRSAQLTVGLVLSITLFAFESLAVGTAMPAVADDLDGLSLFGAAFSAFFLMALVGMSVAGHESDRVGPGAVLAAGMATFAVGLTIASAAPTMEVLVAGRAVQGLGAGTLPTTTYVAAARAYPPADRPRLFAIFSAAWVLPALVAPGIAGVVADHLGWRWVFVGLTPVLALAAALALPPLRALGPGPHAADVPDRRTVVWPPVRLAVGAGLLLAVPHSPALLALALGAGGLVLAARALPHLLPPGVLTARPGLAASATARMTLTFAFFGVDSFLPLALVDVRGRSATVAGLALTAGSLSWSAAAYAQSRLYTRVGPRALASVGVTLLVAGVAVSSAALVTTTPVWLALVGWAIAGAGMGLAFNTISVHGLEHVAEGAEGAASASLQLADAFGVAVATGIGGVIVGSATDVASAGHLAIVWAVMATGALVCLVASQRLDRRPRHLIA